MTTARMKLLLTVEIISLIGIQLHCAGSHLPVTGPSDFKYPELGESVMIAEPKVVTRFSGTIVDPAHHPITKALIEITSKDWEERLFAQFSDERGRFSFPNLGRGDYFVKVTMYGFAPLLLRIKISDVGPRKIELKMNLAT